MRAWVPAAAWAVVLFLLSASPDLAGPSWLAVNDKVGHLCLYMVLGASLSYGRSRSVHRPTHALLIAVGALYAASDEWHQAFVPGRTPDWIDWVADCTGVILGYAVASLLLERTAKREADNNGIKT